jgi:hypothetical protein
MHISSALIASILAIGAFASPLVARDNNNDDDNDRDNEGGLKRICPGLKTQDNGCIRYTRGFDVTGVVTEVDLTFPKIKNECDCIQECLKRPGTCANYVWKFSTPDSVKSGHRTCTLYSNFNLPAQVTLAFDVNNPMDKNIQLIAQGNNPQQGAPVPQAFKDVALTTTPDPDAVSGPVWTLTNGKVQC